jgi:uncharacterized membrane protein YeaQ/YmgE (transglycosylase-associated protein family)
MSLYWGLLFAVAAGWLAAMLMNGGDFDGRYFLAALAGALLFPYVASFLAHTYFNRDIPPGSFAGLQPRCAGALIACLVFDGVKRLSLR